MLDEFHAGFSAHKNRGDNAGENHQIASGKNRNLAQNIRVEEIRNVAFVVGNHLY